MSNYTRNEEDYLDRVRERLSRLRSYLLNQPAPRTDAELSEWFTYLSGIRSIQGNFSNDLSFVASLMAKSYLNARFDIDSFDVALKPQGAPGLDLDLTTTSGVRIIGEIKTTVPYSAAKNDFGAQQKASFQRDFQKLNAAIAKHKFLFVTHPLTYEVLHKRYASQIPEVQIVLLSLTPGSDNIPTNHIETLEGDAQ